MLAEKLMKVTSALAKVNVLDVLVQETTHGLQLALKEEFQLMVTI